MKGDFTELIERSRADEDRSRWESAARLEAWRWRVIPDGCPACGERIGHWGGGRLDDPRPPCQLLPMNVPLEEVRPNCYTVRRYWIGDAIRAATEKAA